jgi:cold shock CspA family protein
MFGTVLHYDRILGYGWIVADQEDTPDFFVCPAFIQKKRHHKYLTKGQRVEFDPVGIDTDRPQAQNVRLVTPVTIARQVGEVQS